MAALPQATIDALRKLLETPEAKPAVDIKVVADLALRHADALLAEWFPAGRRAGNEFSIGNLRGEPGKSLSINVRTGAWADFASEAKGGDLVSLYAAAYCVSQGDAARELGEELGAGLATLAPARPAETWGPMVPPPPDLEHPAFVGTVHVYRDAGGNPTHYIQRIEATAGGDRKQFRPWTYGTLNGMLGWHCKHVGAPRPLYGLDRLADRPDAPVIVCEGEKAADAAAAMFTDHVCVTWPGGTGAVGLVDFSPLAGRDVILWPDNDEPGIKAAAEIARRLPAARTLRVDNLPAGADAADVGPLRTPLEWLAARFPATTSHPVAAKATDDRWLAELDLNTCRVDNLTQGDPEPEQFLLDPLFPVGTVGAIFGEGGIGKSMAVLDLCLSVSAPRKVCGNLPSIPGPFAASVPHAAGGAAIFINMEDNVKNLHRRITSLDPTRRRTGAPFYYLAGVEMPDFDPALVKAQGKRAVFTRFAESGVDRLLDRVEVNSGCPVKLLVLDPAGDFIDGPEDQADFVKPLMRQLRGIAARRMCTIVLVGHTPKSTDPDASPTMRGSGAWIYNGRFAYGLSKPARPKGRAGGKLDPSRHVWGELVKANHFGAPVNRRRLFERDAATGRLTDVTASFFKEETSKADLLYAIVEAIGKASDAGHAVTRTGKSGLHERRNEFPECLKALSRSQLSALAGVAIKDGWVFKLKDGRLVPADEAEVTEDDDTLSEKA